MKSINLSGLRDRKRVLALLNEGQPFELLERKKVIAHFMPTKPQSGVATDLKRAGRSPNDHEKPKPAPRD